MRSSYILVASLAVATAKTYHPSFDASIGNSDGDYEYRKISLGTDSGWKAKGADEAEGDSLSKAGHLKFGYRFTDDDESAIVWSYDTSVATVAGTATWTATDTSVDSPDIGLEYYYTATFPEATASAAKPKNKERQSSDVWDDGDFASIPWQDVSVQVSQDSCPDDQNFVIEVTDTDGNSVGTASGINEVDFTIPADSAYPVTIEVSGDVGSISTVLTDTTLPIQFAIGDGDNAPTQTFQYLIGFDFCPDNYID